MLSSSRDQLNFAILKMSFNKFHIVFILTCCLIAAVTATSFPDPWAQLKDSRKLNRHERFIEVPQGTVFTHDDEEDQTIVQTSDQFVTFNEGRQYLYAKYGIIL